MSLEALAHPARRTSGGAAPRRTFTPPRPLVWIGLVAVFFAAVAPTLSWLEFSGGVENLNIATALELRRDHPDTWLIPTLEGETRIKKPPLTAWVTAHAIRPSTVAALSSPDPAVRRAAADRLAFEARWPSLLAACLMLVAVYELGRVCADSATGLLAAVVCGTTLMFLRFGRTATIDVHLALWVTVANVCLAHAILKDRRWIGCVGAGLALGLAFLAKGPVGFVQTIVPVLAYTVAVRLWIVRNPPSQPAGGFPLDAGWNRVQTLPAEGLPIEATRAGGATSWIAPTVFGILVMLTVAAPWYVYVVRNVPEWRDVWHKEAVETRGERPSPAWAYLSFLPLMLPWTVSFIGGLISARRGMILAAFLAVVPLVAMTLYKDRKERYAYPMAGAGAVVAAWGVMTLARKREPWNGLDRAAVAQHWALLVVFGVVLPAAAATTLTPWLVTATGDAWLTRAAGAGLTIGLGLVVAAGMLLRDRWVPSLAAVTVIVMLTIHAAVIHGYAKTNAGLSAMRPLAEAIWRAHPDAQMYNAHPRGKRVSVDLSIYLNRATELVTIDQLAQLRPGPRPKVVVMLQDHKGTPPTPPPGWQYVHHVPRDKDFWHAFALPAAR
jgi:4-amino-4-deoxy-L-arabinose transferase-like glycosyltransferase